MSQRQPPPQSLDEMVEQLKRELTDHADQERARITAAAEAEIDRIHGSGEIVVPEEPRRSPRRFERSVEPPPADDVPAGALLLARRMADEGHPREEVAEFLADNFRRIDVAGAVDRAFQDAHATH